MDVHKQIYKLNVKHFKAAFVDEILFTHPGHLVSILTSLRKQAYLNHLFSSCIRPKQISSKYFILYAVYHLSFWLYQLTALGH